MKRISVTTAVIAGTLWVNIPVLPLMFTPSFIFFLITQSNQSDPPTLILLGLFLVGFVLAWFWWSVMVPRWRLWAWPRVEDLASLKQQAVSAGLIWPDGHVFNKTEFRTKETQSKLQALEARKNTDA